MTLRVSIIGAKGRATLLGAVIAISSSQGQGEVVFEDSFENFELGETWKPHGVGEPDASLSVVGVGDDGSSLRIGTTSGDADETHGLEISPISLAGVRAFQVEVRIRPLNQTAVAPGGASDASVGLAVMGDNGAFARISAMANRADPPDWADFYSDSEGSVDEMSIAFLHFPPNDPDGAAEAFRTHVIEITNEGTKLTTLGSGGEPLETTPFDIFNPNLSLSDFGENITVALFQLRSGEETSLGDVDHIIVSVEADPKPIRISSITVQKQDSMTTITFDSKPNFTYSIEVSPDLRDWIELTDGLESQGDATSFVEGDISQETTERYYRVREENQ